MAGHFFAAPTTAAKYSCNERAREKWLNFTDRAEKSVKKVTILAEMPWVDLVFCARHGSIR